MRGFTLFLMTLLAFCSAAWAGGFGSRDLESLLAHDPATGRPVDDIDELLARLPREMRARFTLVYNSRGPLRSDISAKYPRVVLFSDDARMVLSFVGDPDARSRDLLEAISFDDATARFPTRAYVLPAAQRRGFVLTPGEENCARCHGADARPLFDSYPLWPGFYGSALDGFPHDEAGETEARLYRAFRAGSTREGVYRRLVFGEGTAPYIEPASFNLQAIEHGRLLFPLRPNTRLGMALSELNRRRIYRLLSSGPGFAVNERLILADLLECPGAETPDPARLAGIAARLAGENAERRERMSMPKGSGDPRLYDMQELGMIDQLAALERAAELAGVDMSDWSMGLANGSLGLFDGILGAEYAGKSFYLKEDVIEEMLRALAAREPAFRAAYGVNYAFGANSYPFGRRLDIGKALKACEVLARGG